MADRLDFLPVSKQDMEDRGWWYYDYLVVNDDINTAVWQVQQIMRLEKGKED